MLEKAEKDRTTVRLRRGRPRTRGGGGGGRAWRSGCPDRGRWSTRRRDELSLLLSLPLELRCATRILALGRGLALVRLLAFSHGSRSGSARLPLLRWTR